MKHPAILTATGADGRELLVEFYKSHDRFVHRVYVIDGGEPILLCQSIEGGDEAWPPSPPLQQLDATILNGRRVFLLVGMAGGSHWSMSVEADDRPSLLFDVACRTGSKPAWLGSSYRFAAGSSSSAEIIGEIGEPTVVDAEQYRLQAPLTDSVPATFRWRYRIQ